MPDITGATTSSTDRLHPERVEPTSSAPLTNLGFVPTAGPLPTADTFMDRHVDMARLIADPTAVLLTALTQWATATQDHNAPVVAFAQVMDAHYGGQVTEGLTARQCLLVAQLFRHDTDLRTAGHPIPTAAGTGAQR